MMTSRDKSSPAIALLFLRKIYNSFDRLIYGMNNEVVRFGWLPALLPLSLLLVSFKKLFMSYEFYLIVWIFIYLLAKGLRGDFYILHIKLDVFCFAFDMENEFFDQIFWGKNWDNGRMHKGNFFVRQSVLFFCYQRHLRLKSANTKFLNFNQAESNCLASAMSIFFGICMKSFPCSIENPPKFCENFIYKKFYILEKKLFEKC